MNKVKIYLCMPFRGQLGEDATEEDIEANILKAKAVGSELSKAFHPNVEVFIPHINQEILTKLWQDNHVTTDQILNACCQIVRTCDYLIAVGAISQGMAKEIATADEYGIPVAEINEWNGQQSLEEIAFDIVEIQSIKNK